MKFEEVKIQIVDFKKNVKAYKKLLFSSADYGEIVSNREAIEDKRSNLMKTYARLEVYIQMIGKNPQMSDGVWANLYSVHDNGLSSDILNRVGPSIEGILTDLDYIEGKLESITEKEFDDMFRKKDNQRAITATKTIHNKKDLNYWNAINPFWLMYKLMTILWEHKIISGIITTIIAGYLLWRFGWTK